MKNQRKMLSIATVFLVSALTFSMFPHQAESAASGLVGYWKFDEGSGNVAYDSSGNGNDGSITGAKYVSGIAGSALKFTNLSTYVNFTRFPNGLEGNKEFTVSIWVKISTWPSTTQQYAYIMMFGRGEDYGFDKAFHVLLANDDGYSPFGTVRAGFWGRTNAYTAHTFSTGIWYNWAFVYDKTRVRMYQNGTFLEDIMLGGASPNLDASGIFIFSTYTGVQFFDGILDEIAIYNYTRTAEEILDYYNAVIEPNPQGPFWTQWYFWTNIPLAVVTVGFAFAAVHYRKKASSPKETKRATSPPLSREEKTCSNCGANLPADSKFCGKCGTSLE